MKSHIRRTPFSKNRRRSKRPRYSKKYHIEQFKRGNMNNFKGKASVESKKTINKPTKKKYKPIFNNLSDYEQHKIRIRQYIFENKFRTPNKKRHNNSPYITYKKKNNNRTYTIYHDLDSDSDSTNTTDFYY